MTPTIRYDPLDRVIRTDFPDGTISRVEFDAWRQEEWDQNDTVLESGWYVDRGEPDPDLGEPSDPQERAAWLAAQHAATPTVIHLDTLGRPFLSVAHNVTGMGTSRVHEFYRTRTELDIQGNTLAIYDAKQHSTGSSTDALNTTGVYATIRQRFDVLGRRLRVDSPDAGTRLTVQDAAGKPLRQWDSRGQTMRWQYDELQRPTHQYVANGTNEPLVQRTVYGEALDLEPEDPAPPIPRSQERNLRGQVYQVYDCSGLMTSEEFDFKGNLLRTTRRLAEDYTEDPDWSAAKDDDAPGAILTASSGQLLNEAFETSVAYDALNRVTSKMTPDGSVTRHVYNEANLLEEVHVSVRGGGEQPVITNLDYNARGQRALCVHANGTTSEYVYDEETFRLRSLETTRTSPANTLQKLLYTYDPVGNITELQDQADTAPVFGTTTPVSGDGKYEYDALYRLTYAEGREHPGQQVRPAEEQYQLPHPNDLQALVRYEERYAYDEVGNIDSVTHVPDGAGGWTREYTYAQGSNRLLSTSVPGHPLATASYEYDAHGSMIEMPHLPVIQWDYADRLRHADKLGGGDVYYTYDAAGQRVRKVYVHGSIIEERIYLDGYEVYRKHTGLQLDPEEDPEEERQTLHVMDDQRRIAMVETKTWEDDVEVGSPVSRWLYQLENHLGSSSMELDHLGAVVSYEEYHPYGATAFHTPRGSAEVSAKRYRYTGKERDEETGLYYHGARYYAPWLGRWTVVDPAGLVDGLNLYRYSRDNPVRFSDPSGTQSTGTRRNLGEYAFTGKETPAELDALARARGYEIVGTPRWDGKNWQLGQVRRIAQEPSGGKESRAQGTESRAETPSEEDKPHPAEDAAVGLTKPLGDVPGDTRVRDARNAKIAAKEAELLKMLEAQKATGQVDHAGLRREAVESRNAETLEAREKSSKLARGAAEQQKPSNRLPTVEDIVDKRTGDLAKKGGAPSQVEVTESVIKGSGKSNSTWNRFSGSAARGLARAGVVLGIGFGVKAVVDAPEGDKLRTAGREVAAFGAGAAAAAAVGVIATSAALAGVAVLPAAAVFAVGFAAAAGAAWLAASLYDRLLPRAQ